MKGAVALTMAAAIGRTGGPGIKPLVFLRRKLVEFLEPSEHNEKGSGGGAITAVVVVKPGKMHGNAS